MVSSYDEATSYLVTNGWDKINPASFKKNGFELVFDTSTYVELYKDSGGARLAETRVDSIRDLTKFLKVNELE